MEQKIELEIRLRELAAQSLLEATSELDVLEVEKSLLTSDQRMNCYATLLEQQRKQLSNPSLVSSQTTDSGRGSRRGNRLSSSSRHVDGNKRASTDVIGATTTTTAAATNEQVTTGSGSPVTSYSSLSNSTQSPSKLSPVSGESSNNIYNSYYSPNSMISSQNGTSNYQIRPTTTGNGNSNISPDDSAAHLRLSSSSQLIMTTPPPMLTTTINSTSTLLSNKQLALTNNNNNKTNNRKNNRQREQLMQSITSLSNINCNMVVEHKANLSISELRIPLMWKDVDHFKGKGDYKRYAVFCLLRIDSQIYDTQLISDVDRQVTDVTFDELVVFNQVKQSFELQLEVYSCVYYEQFSLSSTPRKLKEKLTSSVSKAMGKRLTKQTASTNFTKELKGYEQKSYRFAKIAHTSLKLEDVSNCDEVKTYDLILISPSAHNRSSQQSSSLCQMSNHQSMNNYLSSPAAAAEKMNDCSYQHQHLSAEQSKEAERNTLPLFGHFCAKLVCQPNVFDKTIKSGYLRVALINVPEQQQQQQMSNLNNNTTDHHHSNDTQKLRSTLVATSKQMATLSMSTAQLHWALLRNFAIHLWPIDEQQLEAALRNNQLPHLELSKRPTLTLPVDRYARLLRVSNSSITLDTERGCFVLAAYNCSLIDNSSGNTSHHQVVCDETSQWLRAIEQLIYDSHIWGSVLNHQRSNITANNNCDNTTSTTSLPRRTISTNQHQHLTGRQQQQQQHYAGNVLQADF